MEFVALSALAVLQPTPFSQLSVPFVLLHVLVFVFSRWIDIINKLKHQHYKKE